MPFTHLTDEDFEGKGIAGQPDVPGITGAEMRAKVEELVRDVVKNKINEIVDAITDELATKQELSDAILQAGAVTRVFGRAGNVTAQAGDYTYSQVGAAPATHASQHGTDGADAITPAMIGAAAGSHAHGNITNDGKIGATNGKVIMTGEGGTLTAVDKGQSGFEIETQTGGASGNVIVTLADNTEYEFTNVTALTMNERIGYSTCYGTVNITSMAATPVMNGFASVEGDDYTEMAAGETWEFNNFEGKLIWKNWGVLGGN